MEIARSRDGTLIAYQGSGQGPPLVVVPGVLTSSRQWPVLPLLGEHFTVYAVDRRGHGDSEDTDDYAIEREFEDVAAVVDAIGTEVNVLGHSFGGHCVLGAALLTSNIRRLVVYETDSPERLYQEAMPSDLVDRFQSLVEKGDRIGAVTAFLRDGLQLTAKEIETAKSWPTFQVMVSAAHTFPREIRAAETYRFEVPQCAQIKVPTLLLVGGASPDPVKAAMARWQSVLPNARTVVLPGQAHMAHYTAPELFVRELKSFLVD